MQNFYKKDNKGTKRGKTGFNKKKTDKGKKKNKTFTLDELNNTLNQDSSSKSTGINSNFGGSSSFYTQNLDKVYSRNKIEPEEKHVTFDIPKSSRFKKKKNRKPKVFTDNNAIEDILGSRKRGNSLKTELLLMKSDLVDYKQEVDDYNDIDRFQNFLDETDPIKQEEEYEDDLYGDQGYMSEPSPRDYESMDMSKEIQFMTKEERNEYFEYKKRKKKEKWEAEQKKIASFKPKINKRSKRIDTKRTRGRLSLIHI